MPRRKHNQKRKASGRCIDCGAYAEHGKLRCEGCLMRHRVQKRERRGLHGGKKLVDFG